MGCTDLHHPKEKQHYTSHNHLLRAQQVPEAYSVLNAKNSLEVWNGFDTQ
jgi:hypothetical protein